MAFQGYLIKIGGKILPLSFIAIDSYKATPNQRQDIDSYRDTNGVMQRRILQNKPTKIEFNTPPMTLSELTAFKTYVPISNRDKIKVEYWNDESATYQVADFYMPDPEYHIYQVKGNIIIYRPIRIAFIGY